MAVSNNIGKIFGALDRTTRAAASIDVGVEVDPSGLASDYGTIVADANFINADRGRENRFIWGVHRWGTNSKRIGK